MSPRGRVRIFGCGEIEPGSQRKLLLRFLELARMTERLGADTFRAGFQPLFFLRHPGPHSLVFQVIETDGAVAGNRGTNSGRMGRYFSILGGGADLLLGVDFIGKRRARNDRFGSIADLQMPLLDSAPPCDPVRSFIGWILGKRGTP